MFAYLIDVKWRLHEALDISKGKQSRAFNRVIKLALHKAALYWHTTFMRGHFEREAYTKYGKDYPEKKKKGQRKPFVSTGALRNRMVSKKGPQHLSGTANRVTLKIPIGRPKGMGKKELDMQSAILQKTTGMSKKDADKQVFSGKGYGTKNIKAFQKGIPATNASDEKAVAAYMLKWVVDDINSGGLNRKANSPRKQRVRA